MKRFMRSFLVAVLVGLLVSACVNLMAAASVQGAEALFLVAGTVAAMCGMAHLLTRPIVD